MAFYARKSPQKPTMGWLDTLDIPAIPNFDDPRFNPFVYDQADEWFNTHRETCTRSQMDLLKAANHGADVSRANLSFQENQPRSRSSMSLQENSRPREHPTTSVRSRLPYMTAKPSSRVPPPPVLGPVKNTVLHTVAKVIPIPRPAIGLVSVPHVEEPLKQQTVKLPAVPVAIKRQVPLRLPTPQVHGKTVADARVPILNKSQDDSAVQGATHNALRRPTTVNLANYNRPVSKVAQLRRTDEVENGAEKRRSVEAARAGEYFAHILRAYPETMKVKNILGWK